MTIEDITKPQAALSKPEFPLFAKAICAGPIAGALVLFTSEKEGFQITSQFLGQHWSECWTSCWDTDVWTILPPGTEVTLKVS